MESVASKHSYTHTTHSSMMSIFHQRVSGLNNRAFHWSGDSIGEGTGAKIKESSSSQRLSRTEICQTANLELKTLKKLCGCSST